MKPTAVEYFGYIEGVGYGNLMFNVLPMPMRDGCFPPDHPGHLTPAPVTFGRPDPTDDPVGRLRGRGYFASCFPEGDGIAFKPPDGRSHEQIVRDVEECLNVKVIVRRR